MRILVAGATGFVGSHCVEALAQVDGVEVIAACRDPSALPMGTGGEVRTGDLRNLRDVDALVQGVDVVIHAAAWSSLWNNEEKSKSLYLEPSLNLIDAAQRHGVKRIVAVSSTSVAAPANSADAMRHGSKRSYWPHEANLVRIEDVLRDRASAGFKVVNLRLGLFAGARYGLGLLPILVPWVAGGRTGMPMFDGRDIGQAAALRG